MDRSHRGRHQLADGASAAKNDGIEGHSGWEPGHIPTGKFGNLSGILRTVNRPGHRIRVFFHKVSVAAAILYSFVVYGRSSDTLATLSYLVDGCNQTAARQPCYQSLHPLIWVVKVLRCRVISITLKPTETLPSRTAFEQRGALEKASQFGAR